MRKIILTLACLQVTMTALFAQSNELPKLIPPSPNAAALQRYAEIPVSTYSGIPNISIPLYGVKSGDINVPLSISYHASGVKVSDEASRVGLGWALNAGGVITRQVMGADDWIPTGGFQYFNATVPGVFNAVKYDPGYSINVQNLCTPFFYGDQGLTTYLQEQYDFEPDQYTFNFLGYSGKFILKRNKEVILQSKQKISIQPLDNNGNAWEIKTPDGSTFKFEQAEAYSDLQTGAPLAHKSAWYLTKIISPKNDEVLFTYTESLNYIRTIGSYIEYSNPTGFQTAPPANPCGTLSIQYNLFSPVSKPAPANEYQNVRLDKIQFKNGEVRFNYSTRDDILNDTKLETIQIYSKLYAPESFNLIKQWQFSYEYFEGSGDQDYNVNAASSPTKRLKLKRLTELDANNLQIPPYIFTYAQENLFDAPNYPAKTSFARDHWGYYNGKTTNVSLIPVHTPNSGQNIVVTTLGVMGDNRNADPIFTGLFQLLEITYPTKGKTVFEYESHTYDIPNSNVNDNSFYNSIVETEASSITKIYPGNVTGIQPNINNRNTYLFDLTDMHAGSPVDLKAVFVFNTQQTTCNLPSYYNKIFFTLKKADGTIVSGPTDPFAYLAPNNPTLTNCVGNVSASQFYLMEFTNSYTMPPGQYIWELEIQPGAENLFANISTRMDYRIVKDLKGITYAGQKIERAAYGGGLRIKRMTDFDDEGAPPKIKRFDYHFQGSDGELVKNYSAGRRMNRPVYGYFERSGVVTTCELGDNGTIAVVEAINQHLIYESDSQNPLNGSAGGSVIGYDRVGIFYGESGEYGKTEIEYINQPDVIHDYSQTDYISTFTLKLPRKPPTISTVPNINNGGIKKQIDYEFISGTFRKVKEIENTYQNFAPTVSGWFGIEKRPWKGQWAQTNNCNISTAFYPAMVETRDLLIQTLVKTYDRTDINKSITQTQYFEYDHSTHLQLTRSTTLLSKGESMITEIKYPLDYPDISTDQAVQEMKTSRFMHSIPVNKISTLRKADGSLLQTGGEITKYQVTNGLILPKEIAVFETNTGVDPLSVPAYQPVSNVYPSGYNARVLFDQYDAFGNPVQFKKKDDIPRSYIWDHVGSYPIAEVVNANSNEIAYTSFETGETGNWTLGSNLRNDNALTGTKSYVIFTGNTISRTGLTAGKQYIISYWSKNGALTITGSTTRTGNVRNGWTLYEHTITPSGTTITLTSSSRRVIDELRLYPATAQMTTYTYDPLVGMTSTCTPNNIISYYVYDGFNRLTSIRDFEGNLVKTFEYKYKQ
jgi:hypothetical protein